MKKFYSLALIAAACTLSVSAKDLKAVRTLDNVTPVTNLTAAKAELNLKALPAGVTPAISNRADANFDGYKIICLGSLNNQYSFEDPCTFSAAAEANTYVMTGFYYSMFEETSNPINVVYSTEVYEGETYEFLTIPAGQVLGTYDGRSFTVCAAGNNGTNWVYDDSGNIPFLKVTDAEANMTYWVPAFSFTDYPNSGLLFIDLTSKSGYRIADPEWDEPNCTFTATCNSYKNNPSGQGVIVDETYDVNTFGVASSFKRLGKNYLQLPGLPYSTFWTGDYINLEVANDGSATATGAVCGSFYTDNTQTTTFDAYYWTPSEGNETMPVSVFATVSENTETNQTTVTFALDTIYLGSEADSDPTKCGWMGIEWANPVYTINGVFGITAGVDKVAADVEFDENAPVEYYNLQGQRVANPEAGQLVIKKQGAKVAKVVIR